eukprot:7651258-Ditylum_brightwellii.AAC.1
MDLCFTITKAELSARVGPFALEHLEPAFGKAPFDTICLCWVSAEGPSSAAGKIVPFHVDYSHKTMQVTLNDEDEYDRGL